jgi:sporulation protein YlmC with PRC-barrel domain
MKRFTLLASVATLAAAPAFAQNDMSEGSAEAAGSGANGQMMAESEYRSGTMDSGQLQGLIRTSNIVGGDVYAVDQEDEWAEQEWNELEFVEETDDGWEDIGNITDVVLSPDGRQVGLIVSHGGFLDIGDDTVLLSMQDVKRIGSVDAIDGDFNYVVRMTEDQIEQMNEVEENWF